MGAVTTGPVGSHRLVVHAVSANRQQVAATDWKGGRGPVVAYGVDNQDNNSLKQHNTGCKQHMEGGGV